MLARSVNKEKSCGAIVAMNGWNMKASERKYLLVKSGRDGHWGFPKGHVEIGETEQQTAIREVLEETGLNVVIENDFRCSTEYKLKTGKVKEAVYFTATYAGIGSAEQLVVKQDDEIGSFLWATYEETMKIITYDSLRDIMQKAHGYVDV